jgi:hypothetical protein
MNGHTIELRLAVRDTRTNVRVRGLVGTSPQGLARLSPAAVAAVAAAICRELVKNYVGAWAAAPRRSVAGRVWAWMRRLGATLFGGGPVVERAIAIKAVIRETDEKVHVKLTAATPELGDLSTEAMAAVCASVTRTLAEAHLKALALRGAQDPVGRDAAPEDEDGIPAAPADPIDWLRRGNLN